MRTPHAAVVVIVSLSLKNCPFPFLPSQTRLFFSSPSHLLREKEKEDPPTDEEENQLDPDCVVVALRNELLLLLFPLRNAGPRLDAVLLYSTGQSKINKSGKNKQLSIRNKFRGESRACTC